jgi:hypothetical protein
MPSVRAKFSKTGALFGHRQLLRAITALDGALRQDFSAPPLIQTGLQQHQPSSSGKRRHAAVMFRDLADTTRISTTFDYFLW